MLFSAQLRVDQNVVSTRMRFTAILVLLNLLCSCAVVERTPLARHIPAEMRSAVPLADHYQVSRQQHYPLSSEASLFVTGEDHDLVAQLSVALAPYFKSVSAAGEHPPAAAHTGFELHIERLPNSGREGMLLRKDNEHLSVTVRDLDQAMAFDRVLISVEREELLWIGRSALRSRALTEAAAQLAGDS